MNKTIFQLQLLRGIGASRFPLDKQAIELGLRWDGWEVPMTAAFVACRLGLTEFYPLIRNIDLPGTSRSGLDADDRSLLNAFKKAVLALLAGTAVPPDCETEPANRAMIESHLLRCTAGAATRWHERVWWWAHTLTCPVSLSTPPQPLPENIVIDDDGNVHLALTEIEIVWIGPGTYWVGDERLNELQAMQIEAGFFLARLPVSVDYTQPLTSASVSWPEAMALCERIANIEQLCVELPTYREWEIAARGLDSRRFPWGNAYETGMLAVPAACGAQYMVGHTPQWTVAPDARQSLFIAGAAQDYHCSSHRSASAGHDLAAVRPVIRLP